MESIIFYYRKKQVGKCPFPGITSGADRMAIARSLGIKMYNRWEFTLSDGTVRKTSDVLKNKSELNTEL